LSLEKRTGLDSLNFKKRVFLHLNEEGETAILAMKVEMMLLPFSCLSKNGFIKKKQFPLCSAFYLTRGKDIHY